MIWLLAYANDDEAVWIGILAGLFSYIFSIGGFLLAILLIARLMREKRQPSNTLSWLMVIVLIPHIGVPLYLLLGGRKLRRLASRKHQLYPPKRVQEPIHFDGWEEGHPLFRAASSPPSTGNRLDFLLTGEQAYEVLVEEIQKATHSIHIMAFILGRDEVGRALVQLLAQRAREGVKVRLLLDALGCLKTRGYFVEPLRRAGGETARFMPMLPIQSRWSANLRNHRKIAIFDHERAIVGGHNLALEYMGPLPYDKRFQDFGARITGPAVAELNEIFIADWNFATRVDREPLSVPTQPPPPEPDQVDGLVQVIASGPDVAHDPLYEAILLLVQEAREDITLLTPYFIPDEVLFRSLILKLHSGKRVTIIVPRKSNHPLTDFARAHYLRELKAAGANILTYLPGMLHAKVILVDGRVAMLGSANIDLRSLFVNYEIGMFCYSVADVANVYEWAETIAASSASFEADRERPPGFVRTLAEDLSRLLAPLM
jgi:cardiolipin synthase A/B